MRPTATPKRFERLRYLGEGGMGVVYEALDRERGTRVAVKTLRNLTGESLSHLKREFRAMQDVHHPNLVSLGELVFEDDDCFFSMELVEGVDWLEHVRGSRSVMESLEDSGNEGPFARTWTAPPRVEPVKPFDEERLRDSLRQLAEALHTLHVAGLVHRDVKPSNVRVTHEGRVVLLDFGLVAVADGSLWTSQAAGTPAYMAPEQVGESRVGQEADWYAVGVMLFEALTGTLPFTGTAWDVALRKLREAAPPPSSVAEGVPADLSSLSAALMRVEPSARPTGQQVLVALGASRAARSPSSMGSPAHAAPFVGRVDESVALMSAFRGSREEPVTVLVEGESGVGKSLLVRNFLHRLALEVSDVIVLAGRCYERESVPYKAFDGVVDALARMLSHLPKEEAQQLVPTKPSPLVRVFPVLRRVSAIAERVRGPQPLLDPQELRARAFSALRDLFTRIAERRPLVLVIDDAQWADADSLTLLADLMRPPDAPPLLLVMTARAVASGAEASATDDERRPTLASTMQWEVRRIALSALPPEDARALATELLARAGVTGSETAAWFARQAGGHPFFIDMMVRQADRLASSSETLVLEDVIWSMVEQLDSAPRVILETVAVAAAPMTQEAVARATAIDRDTFARAVSLLRASHMVQTRGARDTEGIEPYHDRVRMAVLAHMDPARSADVHTRIALALEANRNVDPESLVAHWRGAGDLERAAHFAVLAGDRASEALAFDRAASFYELALASKDAQDGEGRTLLVKLGQARANAGRGESAAEAFRKAADVAPTLEALDLRRRAAEELLMAGDFDRGTAALHQVLAAVGMRAPRSRLATLFWLVAYGIWQTIVGLRFKDRTRDEISPMARARVDALFAAARGFAVVDPLMSRCMSRRHLITALRTGDTTQVMRAAAFEVSNAPIAGGPISKRERRLVSIAQRLPKMDATGVGKGFFRATLGVSLFLRCQWRPALENLDGAYTNSEGRSAGRQAQAQLFAAWTLMFLGEYRELARRHARLLADADTRGDLYTSVQLRDGYNAVMWLAADEPETARRHIRDAMAKWSHSRFLLQHWHAMLGETDIELYLGNGEAAYERCARDLPAVQKSLLLKCEQIRVWTMFMRGRCAVASANAEPGQRKQRLVEARSMIRRLEREFPVCAAAFAALISAAVSNVEGDRPGAIAALRAAMERAEDAHMAMHAATARYALGLLLGSEEGTALVQQAEDAMRAQDVSVPSRLAAIWLPGRWENARFSA